MKILAFTSIRSDYDLLSPLYKLLHQDRDTKLKLLVSGAHLSRQFGMSRDQIVDDGYDILLEIETLIHSDSPKSRLKTGSLLLQNSIDVVAQFKPDVLLYAGDREDVMMGALLGVYLNIPTIHFYGGDHEEDGHQDTAIRHATSKLSSLHFVSNAQHKARLISMGEATRRIFDVGSISLDKFSQFSPQDISVALAVKVPNKFVLVIFHPLHNNPNKESFQNILKVLKQKGLFVIVSYPNTDPGYDDINDVIASHQQDPDMVFYRNLSRDLFLTLFSSCQFIIGNSSAGIYEAATLKKPAINVGLRQQGRAAAENVVFCDISSSDIAASIDTVMSSVFQKNLAVVNNPYGDGKSALKAYRLIKSLNLAEFLIKDEDPLKMHIDPSALAVDGNNG